MPLPLDLRLLWYFKRTAEIRSLTKAAAELRTSQQALTRHIMRLEHELRATLLLRDQRGVTPTEAGALVLDKAENPAPPGTGDEGRHRCALPYSRRRCGAVHAVVHALGRDGADDKRRRGEIPRHPAALDGRLRPPVASAAEITFG
jgi:Bacterial regulatory helix-turn-helix protein, lysR family